MKRNLGLAVMESANVNGICKGKFHDLFASENEIRGRFDGVSNKGQTNDALLSV